MKKLFYKVILIIAVIMIPLIPTSIISYADNYQYNDREKDLIVLEDEATEIEPHESYYDTIPVSKFEVSNLSPISIQNLIIQIGGIVNGRIAVISFCL